MTEASDPMGQNDDAGHLPVLPGEVLAYLDPRPGRVVLDCTVGRGGHGALFISRLGPGGRYIGLDMDPGNADYSRALLTPIAERAGVRLDVVRANFREARAVLDQLGIGSTQTPLPRAGGEAGRGGARDVPGSSSAAGPHPGPLPGGEGVSGRMPNFPGAGEQHPGAGVDCLLADLGFASNQMDDASRGLAFSGDGPLDMRLDPGADITAERLVNTLPEKELADLIYEFGEERLSRRIARKIVEQRQTEPITTTSGLADLVRRCYPRPKGNRGSRGHRIHPATRTFMALRIAVNDELGSLDSLLEGLPGLLNPGGRAAIISFHSLEDRRVKRAYQALRQERGYDLLTRKPVTAEDQETDTNPRSRSAKMRVIRKPTTA